MNYFIHRFSELCNQPFLGKNQAMELGQVSVLHFWRLAFNVQVGAQIICILPLHSLNVLLKAESPHIEKSD